MKVMIAVTHLLGSGHLRRALTLAHAFAEAGHEVLLASGGQPVPDLGFGAVRLLQLPPLRSDGVNFARLLDDTGQIAGAALLAQRRDGLCRALRTLAPDVLITELFPFGRRALAGEFTALLDAARTLPRAPVILSSVRDILAPPSKPAKAAWAEAVVRDRFDAVLVHSDPRATRLEASWPVGPALKRMLHYTGYVAPGAAAPHPERAGLGEILVSAGGGPVGDGLFRCAAAAARLTPERPWRLLVGGRDAGTRIANLSADGSAVIEPARPDFRQMLHHAAASVSLCGYNTALDVLRAGTPAVFVPFDDGDEVEQSLRARALAQMPGIVTLRSAELSPHRLCTAIDRARAAARRTAPDLQFDGAAQTVALADRMAQARR